MILDGGAPMAPVTNTPPAQDLKMHGMPRKQGATRRQIQEFFELLHDRQRNGQLE